MNSLRQAKIIDSMSCISSRLNYALSSHYDLFRAPLESLLMAFCIYRELGVEGIQGMIILLIILPLQCENFKSRHHKIIFQIFFMLRLVADDIRKMFG